MVDRYLLDQLAELPRDQLRRARAVGIDQISHAAAVRLRDCWIECDHLNGAQLGPLADQALPIGLPCGERLADHPEVGRPGLNRLYQSRQGDVDLGNTLVDSRRPPTPVAGRGGDFVVVRLHQQRDRFGAEQLVDQARKDAPFDFSPGYGAPLVARPGLTRAGAGEAAGIDRCEATAAFAAPDQTGKQVLGAVALWQRLGRALGDRILRGLPVFDRYDRQLGQVRGDALVRRVRPRNPAPRFRVSLHLDAVVDEAAGVDRVVEDADGAAA